MRTISLVALTVAVGILPRISSAELIESIDDEKVKVEFGKGGDTCNHFDIIDSPVRSGGKAFRHTVDKCGERSEFSMRKTKIGGTYWWMWSLYLPNDFEMDEKAWDIFNQWAAYPGKKGRKFPCGGVGWKMAFEGKVGLRFDLQFDNNGKDECKQFVVLDPATLATSKGVWLDFVLNSKVTGKSDGVLRLWVRKQGEKFKRKISYKGPTWWEDEDTGPYFKMGLYKGEPNFKGPSPRQIITDSYRLGTTLKDVIPKKKKARAKSERS